MIFMIIFVAAGLLTMYLYINHRYSYWSRRGVPGPRSIYPFGFTLAKTLTRPDEYELGNVRRFGPLYGVYTGTVPTLTVADPVLIKELLVANFHQFSNRRQLQAYNPVWNRNMFNLDVDEWKRVRSICSPVFTSGKLKAMVPLMDRCIDNLVAYIDSKILTSETPGFINVKRTLSGFSIDVIAASAFATETDANKVLSGNSVGGHESSDKKTSDFVHYGTSILKVPPLKVAAALCLPRPLLNFLGISTFFSESSFEFLISLSRKIFRERQSSKSKPAVPDLIQLMAENFTTDQALSNSSYHHLTASMDDLQDKEAVLKTTKSNGLSQNGSKSSFLTTSSKRMLDENEIIGQCVLFFFAGFETTAFTLTTALFELAHHPEIQERLYRELTHFSDKFHSNKNEYYEQLLNHAPYLEAVINEVLRKHPNVVRLERRVSAPEGASLGKIHLDQGVLVEVPIMAVHHNPSFYPEPELFNPERFMPDNKSKLVPYGFLPFGAGPRNCLGMRFAYQEMKLCMARILTRYRFSLAADTPKRLSYAKGAQLLVCEPFHLAVEMRSS